MNQSKRGLFRRGCAMILGLVLLGLAAVCGIGGVRLYTSRKKP